MSRRDRAAQALLHTALGRLRGGSLVVVEAGARRTLGHGPVAATIEVRDPRTWRRVARSGSTGLGLAYADGWWDADDLVAALRLIGRNVRRSDVVLAPAARLAAGVADPVRRRRPPDHERDRRNIRAHYDLGDDVFALFLDASLTYSAALFERPDMTLGEAQEAKLERLCRELRLGPGDHLLEIGTGWGALARHAALRHGCRVTTTTISDRQFAFATRRVREAGLEDRVTVLHDHYRDLRGTYDALVSVEMIEAVDWREHEDFFAACGRLVRPGGRAALQAITIPDQRFDLAKTREDFIKRVIFPGGCLPSVAAIREAAERTSGWELTAVHDLGSDYAETLRRWRAALRARAHELPAHGLGPHFARTFDFYFAYCEAGFDDGLVGDVQLTFTAPGAQSGGAGAGSGIVSGSGVRAGAASRTAAPSTSAAPTSWTPLSTSSNAR